MDATDVAALIKVGVLVLVGIGALVVFIRYFSWKERQVQSAKTWPTTEATIQSGEMETVASTRGVDVVTPCFSFSYIVNGEDYSGRFGLLPNFGNRDAVLNKMKERKFQIHYDPAKPGAFYIPGEQMEGCDIKQRLGDQLVNIYPKG
jgi:hypothetical protein